MAPTPTSGNSTTTTEGGAADDTTGKVSLYIAIAALAISSLLAAMQLLFAYISAATGRNKTNTAALGEWSRYTKYSIREFWKGKLRVSYGVVEISQDSFWKDYLLQKIMTQIQRKEDMKFLVGYRVQAQLKRKSTKDGIIFIAEDLRLLQANVAEEIPVDISTLTRTQRAAWTRIQNSRKRNQPTPCLASWVMFSQHLQYGLETFKPGRWEDADRIPAGCIAPLATIRMSDVIVLGYLLDMSLQDAKPATGEILMTGLQCKIYSEHLPNVGLVSRYDVKAYDFSPAFESTNGMEPKVLMDTARGSVGYSETITSFELLGYNSIDALMDLFLEKADGNGWQEISLDKTRREPVIVGDEEGRWNKKWSDPQTSRMALILSTMCAPSVAKAFPHELIRTWQNLELHRATKDAAVALQDAGYTLLTPPNNFIPTLFQRDYIKSTAYKVTDDYGCEFGGLRSYLSTNLAQFTKQVASCWLWSATPESREKPPVPILSELIDRLVMGTSLTDWRSHDLCTGDRWTLRPRCALWFQVTMLDTWIGYMIDRLMEETAMREVPLPADAPDADGCAAAAARLSQTNAFNPVRGKWLKLYLQRLADGRDGEGDSFMSSKPRLNLAERWEGMGKGTPSQWLALDAVLTMRASVMHGMLMQLDDSSRLLELRENDPLVYMS